MSKLNKKSRRKERPAAIAKESTRVSTNVPTKPRKKLLTKKQAAAEKARIKEYAKNLKPIPKAVVQGSAGSLGLISPGKILKGGKMVAKFIAKHLAKKGAIKAADKKLKG